MIVETADISAKSHVTDDQINLSRKGFHLYECSKISTESIKNIN